MCVCVCVCVCVRARARSRAHVCIMHTWPWEEIDLTEKCIPIEDYDMHSDGKQVIFSFCVKYALLDPCRRTTD